MKLSVYTDGGCSGNPGPGGWAYVILAEEGGSLPPGAHVVAPHPPLLGAPAPNTPRPPRDTAILAETWGAEPATTNNRMELMAVIAALETLPPLDAGTGPISVYTDSQYVQKGITQWVHTWKRNNWRTGGKTPVKNQDLWQRLDTLANRYQLIWAWVRGHAGNPMNERCDRMTQEAIRSLR